MGCIQKRKEIRINSFGFQLARSFDLPDDSQTPSTVKENNQKIIFGHKVVEDFNLPSLQMSNPTLPSSPDKFNQDYLIVKKIPIEVDDDYFQLFHILSTKDKKNRMMKVIKRDYHHNDDFFHREFNVLKAISHKNLLRYIEFFLDRNGYYIITNYYTGVTLFQYVQTEKFLEEGIIRNIMKQLLSGILHLHVNDLMHRNLSLSNIILSGENLLIVSLDDCIRYNEDSPVKVDEGVCLPHYMAPEVIMKIYDKKCDIWACGVIFYYLIYKKFPFEGNDSDEIKGRVKSGIINFDKTFNVGSEAIDLLRKMLCFSSRDRFNAFQCLSHEFFVGEGIDKSKSGLYVLLNESIKIIMRNVYNKDSFMTMASLYNEVAYKNRGTVSSESIKNYFGEIKIEENDNITYEDFLKIVMSRELILKEENMKLAFDSLDKDKDGMIGRNDLKSVFSSINTYVCLGYYLSSLEGQNISFEEFSSLLCNYNGYI